MTTQELGHARVQELSHHGVLGMKWGVTRGGSSGSRSAVPVTTHEVVGGKFTKTRITASGGEHHPAHADAHTAEVVRQKLKRSGSTALSNRELQTLITRGQLETQAHQIESKRISGGRKFVNQVISDVQRDPFGTVRTVGETASQLRKMRTA